MYSSKYINLENKLFDSHAHLSSFSEKYAFDIWNMAVNLPSSIFNIKNLDLPNVKQFVGIDPEVLIPSSHIQTSIYTYSDLVSLTKSLAKLIKENINSANFLGIGEIGMDYYWPKKLLLEGKISLDFFKKCLELQSLLFKLQLDIALEFDLPVSLHSRGAEEECLEILKDYKLFAIFHSFTGTLDTAKEILSANFGLGINGIFTFKNSAVIRETYSQLLCKTNFLKYEEIRLVDLFDFGIYFETDSPYLSPEGFRGESNNPNNVSVIFDFFKKFYINLL